MVENRKTFAAELESAFGVKLLLEREHPEFSRGRRYFQAVAKSLGVTDGGPVIEVADNPDINAFAASTSFDAVVINQGLLDWLLLSASIQGGIETLFPWEPMDNPDAIGKRGREQFSSAMFRTVLDFIYLHELAHIINGHTKLLRNQYSISKMSEVQSAPAGSDLLLDFQTMEFDADVFAINVLAINAFEGRGPKFTVRHEWEQMFSGATHVFMTLVAVYDFFKVLEDAFDAAELPNKTHPPAVYRMGLCCQVTLETIRRRVPLSDTAHIDFLRPLAEYERSLPDQTSRKFDQRRIDDIVGADTWKYFRRCHRNWKSLRPRLLPYARASLPPVQDVDDDGP